MCLVNSGRVMVGQVKAYKLISTMCCVEFCLVGFGQTLLRLVMLCFALYDLPSHDTSSWIMS